MTIYHLKTFSFFFFPDSVRLQAVSIELAAVNFNYRTRLPARLGYERIRMIHPSAENNVWRVIN